MKFKNDESFIEYLRASRGFNRDLAERVTDSLYDGGYIKAAAGEPFSVDVGSLPISEMAEAHEACG